MSENRAIAISVPKIVPSESGARLVATVEAPGRPPYDLWYEVGEEYAPFLTAERVDAFVAGLLLYAMAKGLDIVSACPISERLHYQLSMHQIPGVSRFISRYRPIALNMPTDARPLSQGSAVGMGMSCGVDSFYTFLKHFECEPAGFRPTHLTSFNVGAHGDSGGEPARLLFRDRAEIVRAFAAEKGLQFAWVDSNLSEFLRMDFVQTYTFRTLSAALALQKLFRVYYYSSGTTLDTFRLEVETCAPYDLLTVHCLTTDTLRFYSTGLNARRIEKTAYIADSPDAQKWLNVCTDLPTNCGDCLKCRRTMMALHVLGALDRFSAVFDVARFRRNYAEYAADYLFAPDYKYVGEIRALMREKGIRIPLRAYPRGWRIKLRRAARRVLGRRTPLGRPLWKLRRRFLSK
ncbi:MAG: hypothetical protein GX592_10160 [Clostridiales bacterium]|nr:hypothetical protein [Clostridiales bacterium]